MPTTMQIINEPSACVCQLGKNGVAEPSGQRPQEYRPRNGGIPAAKS